MPIPASLRAELKIEASAGAAGGCIHDCYRVTIGGQPRFLKTNAAAYADAFAAEADGLAALSAAGMRAPKPLRHGTAADRAYLLLEYLELDGNTDFAALGRMLAKTHRAAGARFGWHRDNYIGSKLQQNTATENWKEFWEVRRIRPQLELAARIGHRFRPPSFKLLEGHNPAPSLLHGDLWRGNAGFIAAGPVLFDPAVYYGDREADLAMTELFGGFPPSFYEAYNEAWPLAEGYERRKHLYNLYHLLNHLNHFGASYRAEVDETLRLLLLG